MNYTLKRSFFLLLLYLPGLVHSQGHAGPDKTICLSGTAKLGPETPCTTCCYKWEPSTGLDDPSKPNPVVTGITSTIYAVTVSYPNGDYETDDVKVIVYDANISIYEPEYFAIETMIPEEEKKIPGAQTFVNLDNDDCDAEFDKDDDVVLGGDNELVKIKVTMHITQPPARPGKGAALLSEAKEKGTALFGPEDQYAALDLAEGTSISGIHLWLANDKSGDEYQLGAQLLLTQVDKDDYVVYLWAEGTEAHTMQQQVKLTARAYEDVNPACAGNFVSLTVIGVDKMEWIGVQNGYTMGTGKNNSNTLEHDPNNSDAAAVRVFPEGKFISPTIITKTQDTVILRITLSVKPPLNQSLFLRTFDIDDPSTESNFVDPNDGGAAGQSGDYSGQPYGFSYNPDEDNRAKVDYNPPEGNGDFSSVGSRSGQLFGSNVTVASVKNRIFKRSNITTKTFDIKFKVSSSPGDNYKISVANDTVVLTGLRNLDIFDQQRIVDKCTNLNNAAGCLEYDKKMTSPALTVWRTLHVEHDQMRNPTWADNLMVKGTFSDFAGTFKSALSIVGVRPDSSTFSLFVNPLQPLSDSSQSPRRFENGGLRIGKPEIEICNPVIIGGIGILATGIRQTNEDAVLFTSGTDLTKGGILAGKLKKAGQSELSFLINDIEKIYIDSFDFKVTITSPNSNLSLYQNGDVSIAGGDTTFDHRIQVIDNQHFIIRRRHDGTSNLRVPVELRDDDDIPLNGPSTVIKPVPFTQAKTTFGEVYVDVVNDGGGLLSNNQSNVVFSRNIKVTDAYAGLYTYGNYATDSIQSSKKYAKPTYWCGYILSGWQEETKVDRDPLREPGKRAGTIAKNSDCILASGGDFCIIYQEICREIDNGNISTERTVAHEMGHMFGLDHGDLSIPMQINPCYGLVSLNLMGIMKSEQPYNNTSFIEYHKNIIRCRVKSPGQK
jgi:hypothetical protein